MTGGVGTRWWHLGRGHEWGLETELGVGTWWWHHRWGHRWGMGVAGGVGTRMGLGDGTEMGTLWWCHHGGIKDGDTTVASGVGTWRGLGNGTGVGTLRWPSGVEGGMGHRGGLGVGRGRGCHSPCVVVSPSVPARGTTPLSTWGTGTRSPGSPGGHHPGPHVPLSSVPMSHNPPMSLACPPCHQGHPQGPHLDEADLTCGAPNVPASPSMSL